MIVGQKARIDGVVYEFDQKGIARKVLNPNIVPVSVPTTDLSEVTDDAAQEKLALGKVILIFLLPVH